MPDIDLTVGVDNSGARAGLAELRNFGQKVHNDLTSTFARNFAVAGIVTAVVSLGKSAFEYGARVQDLSDKLGVNTTVLQQWGTVAAQNGSSMESLAQGWNKLIISQSKANSGNVEMIKHFNALGVSVQDLRNLSPDEIAKKIGASNMEASDIVAIFGKNALELVPTFRSVADGTATFGAAMDENVIKKFDRADDARQRFGQGLMVLSGNILANQMDFFTKIGLGSKAMVMDLAEAWSRIIALNTAVFGGFAKISEAANRLGMLKTEELPGQKMWREKYDPASQPAPKPGDKDFIGPLRSLTSVEDSPSPGGSTETKEFPWSIPGLSNKSGAGGNLSSKLAKLERDNYMAQLDALEKIKAIEMERGDLQEELNRGRADGNLTLDEDEELQVGILEKTGEISKIQTDLNEKQAAINEKMIEARELADKQVLAAERQNELLRLTAGGHEDIAAQLAIEWEYHDKINAAIAAGNTALAEQLTVQKELVQAARQKAAEEANAAARAKASREGFGINPGTDAIGRALAQGIQGVGYEDQDVMEATDEYTGIVDQQKLRLLRLRNEIGMATDAAKFGSGAVQGGSAVPRRSVAAGFALKAKMMRLIERQRVASDRATRDDAREHLRKLYEEESLLKGGGMLVDRDAGIARPYTPEERAARLAAMPGTPEYSAAARSTLPVVPGAGGLPAPLNPELASMMRDILGRLDHMNSLIQGPPGS